MTADGTNGVHQDIKTPLHRAEELDTVRSIPRHLASHMFQADTLVRFLLHMNRYARFETLIG